MSEITELSRTVLHGWHEAAGAKMVEFGGWHMPVQYPTGIIREHLATRRHAGLFDVSHMGRFRITGAAAEAFLLKTLTNNARALLPGEAQYTLIANETGGAVDDAYLYRLGRTDYLLVVNAANRDKDWAWLSGHNDSGAAIEDVSAALAMISLQGPRASEILEEAAGSAGQMPENKRNRLSVMPVDGQEVIVARTGYTGEAVCFELFVDSAGAVALWQRLVECGAAPAGLGARDSLRLEAGLPLYGHELGPDRDGNEIPIFANPIAAIAVRAADGDYVGRAALDRQREEFVHIRRGELATPVADRLLKQLVQPIAVFGAQRPLRAGFDVFFDGAPAGYVTSGTSVPFARFYGEGVTGVPSEEHEMRPIGLALIRSDLEYRTDRPVALEIADARGNRFDAELVEKNLWPLPPYTRPYTGFAAPKALRRLDAADITAAAVQLAEESAANTGWRRRDCINLIPSEQPTSAYVDALVTADPAGRYNEHNRIRALGPEAPDLRYYKGTDFIMEKEDELKAALRAFFGCTRVEPRVISGQMANDTVYDALKQFRNRHRGGRPAEPIRRVLVHDLTKGGHLSAQPTGALKNYVALDPESGRPAVEHFPFEADNPYRIDVAATKALIAETRPELLVFGRSVTIETEPVAEIAEFIHAEFGADNPARPLIMYDGAHVLGLLGPHFQAPLAEGADIVTGSTHKTFFGPQRGVILADMAPGSAFEPLWRQIETRAFPGHVSNHHLGTMLGLLGATWEMIRFRDEYPAQVIRNAQAFARALRERGLAVEGDPAAGYTRTHQVLLRTARARGEYAASRLEANNVITNPQALYDDASFAAASGIRMGAQEMTRYGMKEADFAELAALLAEILGAREDEPPGSRRDAVRALRGRFLDMRYCF
ncbi:MAG: glycine cleavage system aminomethyltransferase GcvT [Rhodospirillales bacterium]|nr:MAG: glycine cleavage system aminomethyltransferase GcvT [Rhodospirillales bacterium]